MNIMNYGEQDFEAPNTWRHIHYLTVPVAVGRSQLPAVRSTAHVM